MFLTLDFFVGQFLLSIVSAGSHCGVFFPYGLGYFLLYAAHFPIKSICEMKCFLSGFAFVSASCLGFSSVQSLNLVQLLVTP